MTAGTQAAPAWWRPTSRQAAGGLGALALLMIAASGVLTVTSGNLSASSDGSTLAVSLAFLTVGFLVALRKPRNPIGWLMMVTALATAFTTAEGLYVLVDYGSHHGTLPLGRELFLAGNALWPVGLLVGMAAVLLFPDGRLLRRWRRALWAYAAVGVAVVVTQAIPALAFERSASFVAIAADRLTTLPAGTVTPAVEFLASGLPVLAVVPFWLAWVGYQVANYRRSDGDARQQYKWFTAGAAACLAGLVVSTVADSSSNASSLRTVVGALAIYAAGAFPLGMGVAVLRYRLYDIDRIISRTLAYTIVTGLLVGVYAGLVILATTVAPHQSADVAAATLAAAALFSPVRRRVQRAVDRRFNRARYNADQTIAAFAARLRDQAHSDTAQEDLLATIETALEPAHVSLWVGGDVP